MPSRKSSTRDRERRRDEALAREINRAGRSSFEQFDLLTRAPGKARREVRRLHKGMTDEAPATLSHMPEPPHAVSG